MNILILGGNSQRHDKWTQELKKQLEIDKHEVRVQQYAHWKVENAEMDFEVELAALPENVKNFDDFIVLAKSAGTLLTTVGVARELFSPSSCLLLGFPVKAVIGDKEVARSLPLLPETIFLQNTADPYGDAEELQNYIEAREPERYALETDDKDDHDYVDFERIRALIAEL